MSASIKPTKTAGEIHNYLRQKPDENVDPRDLAHAFCDETFRGVVECIERHFDTFNEKLTQFCVMCTLCHGEGNLKYLVRRKFCALPWLPTPFPYQSVWIYDKPKDVCTLLWSLPGPAKMATLSEEYSFLAEDQRMKIWCDAFFKGAPTFWKTIRKMHNIDLLSESEIAERNWEKGDKSIDQDFPELGADTFYLPEIRIKKLETESYAARNQPVDYLLREAN